MTDWYRTAAWQPADREDFERRLARARPWNRPQYLRIKALALLGVGERAAATALLDRIVCEYPESFDAAFALERLALADLDDGRPDAARTRLEELIRTEPRLNGTTGLAHVWLAQALRRGGAVAEAAEVLAAAPAPVLPLGRFEWWSELARVAAAAGDADSRMACARAALDTVARPHDRLYAGIPQAATPERLAELRALADPRWRPPRRRRWRWKR